MAAPTDDQQRRDHQDGPARAQVDRRTVGRRRVRGLRAPRGHWAWAALVVIPYLLLSLAWVGSNPPGAAPDEKDHLVKALGMSQLDIGVPYDVLPPGASPAQERNASISRLVEIPGDLDPAGYSCFAFRLEASATCLPDEDPVNSGDVARVTPVGAYPPFFYVPMGLAASLTDSPYHAFLAARLASVALSAAFLFLGVALLLRWLGRPALLGVLVALTPMVMFSASVVSTSGVEITAAVAIAAIAIVLTRHPEALYERQTQWTLAVAGVGLVLSRQLGVVTLGVLTLVVLVRMGLPAVWRVLRVHQAPLLLAIAGILGAGVVLAIWELRYDHPAVTGPVLDGDAWELFLDQAYGIIASGIGVFGWLDTFMPGWGIALWIVMVVGLVLTAMVLGRRRDIWTLVSVLVAMVLVGFTTFATVFYPIQASVQGRHLLALFVFVPMLSGVVVTEVLAEGGRHARLRGLITTTAVAAALGQMIALHYNARRYATGVDGPIWSYLTGPEWSPGLGWAVWMGLGLVGAVLLVAVTRLPRETLSTSAPEPGTTTDASASQGVKQRVER